MDIGHEQVSGRAVVHSFTRAEHAFIPGLPVPYVIAIVELVEQPGLRMMTNITGCDPADVRIGLQVIAVFVSFSGRDDIAVPHFQPDPASA